MGQSAPPQLSIDFTEVGKSPGKFLLLHFFLIRREVHEEGNTLGLSLCGLLFVGDFLLFVGDFLFCLGVPSVEQQQGKRGKQRRLLLGADL